MSNVILIITVIALVVIAAGAVIYTAPARALAKRQLSRGEKLGRDEAVSYIAASLFEDAHRGCTADELKNIGYGMLRRSEAVSGVPETISPLSVKLDLFTGPAVITIESPFAD